MDGVQFNYCLLVGIIWLVVLLEESWWYKCWGSQVDFSLVLFSDSQFLYCDLNNSYWCCVMLFLVWFDDCKFIGVYLQEVSGWVLEFCNCLMVSVDLCGLLFCKVQLDGMDFFDVELFGCDFCDVVFNGGSLCNVQMCLICFEGVDLCGIDISGFNVMDVKYFWKVVILYLQVVVVLVVFGLIVV